MIYISSDDQMSLDENDMVGIHFHIMSYYFNVRVCVRVMWVW